MTTLKFLMQILRKHDILAKENQEFKLLGTI